MTSVPLDRLPAVSAIIPCYNQGEYLVEAIESALNQSHPKVEVIVVNDGSTDETHPIATRYQDRILYLRKPNKGLSAARNSGILAARGEFVHFLDADDFLPPNLLERQLGALQQTPHADVLHGGWQEVDACGRPEDRNPVRPLQTDAFHSLLRTNLGPPCCVSVRRAAFANTGLFDVSLTSCEDWDMWLRLAAAGAVFTPVTDTFVCYRKHPKSMSQNYERMWRMANRVLHKAARSHDSCRICRSTIHSTRRRLRDAYYGSIIYQTVLARYQQKQYATASASLLQAVLRHPAMSAHLLSKSVRRLRRMMGAGQIASHASQAP